MRITNKMLVSNMIVNLQHSMRRLDTYFNQLETGRKFSVPSEDPAGTFLALRAQSEIALNEQLQENIQLGKGWLEVTDTAFNELGEIYHRIKELMVYSANGSHEDSSFGAFASEVKEIRESLLEIGNTQYGERFIFAGQKTTKPPFIAVDQPYQGDLGEIKVRLARGVEVPINKPGSEVFTPLMETLTKYIGFLEIGDTESISNISLSDLEKNLDDFLAVRSEIGACVRRFDMTATRLIDQEIELNKALADAGSVDMAKVITELKMEESTYRAALAAGARIIQPSLMEFLR